MKYITPPELQNTEQLHQEANARRRVLNKAGLSTFTIGRRGHDKAIICLCCGLGSAHPDDIKHRYCGFCNQFHMKSLP